MTGAPLPARDIPPTRPLTFEQDDVLHQPVTVVATLVAIAIILTLAFVVFGATFDPSRIIETNPAFVTVPSTDRSGTAG